jgi:hypothetical protein
LLKEKMFRLNQQSQDSLDEFEPSIFARVSRVDGETDQGVGDSKMIELERRVKLIPELEVRNNL